MTTEKLSHTGASLYTRVGFAVLIVCFYFFGLDIPLVGPDEPRYAQVAREMFERNDWITPTLGGFNWFEKPALLYWLQIISYKLFGVSEFAARFGSAIFGLGTIAALWVLGRIAVSPSFGDWLALIAASTIGIVVFSRGASFDIVLTLSITAALVSFFLFDNSRGGKWTSRAALMLFYVFIGVALLAKGLVGAILPFGVVGLYYLASRRFPTKDFLLSLVWGPLIAVVIASSWYVPMYHRHGYQFVDEFIIQHHFQRFTSNKYQHPQPPHFFFWVLPLMTIPWLPFFFVALWNFAKDVIRSIKAAGRVGGDGSAQTETRLRMFAFSWMIVPILFFSMSGSKLPGYILPSVPGAVVLTVLFIWPLAKKSRSWRVALSVVAIAVFLTCTILLLTTVPNYAAADSVKPLISNAAQRGFTDQRVLAFHTRSHNAEFYAASRLVREPDGKQKNFTSINDLINEAAISGGTALVLTPIPYSAQLRSNEHLNMEYLMDNGELAIVAVTVK